MAGPDENGEVVQLRPPRPPLLSSGAIPQELASPILDPIHKLKIVLDAVERAEEEWREACNRADGFADVLLTTFEKPEAENRKAELRNEIRKLYNRWYELQQQAHKVEQEVRRRKLEAPLAGRWRDEFNRLREELTEQYAGLGAHYDLLCDNCAATAVRLRQMEESGRDFDSGEYVELHKLHLGYVNQLQKYTEAMKSESINRQTQEVAEKLVQIFERHFGTSFPEQWREAVADLKKEIEAAA
jgi:hypothetical protein